MVATYGAPLDAPFEWRSGTGMYGTHPKAKRIVPRTGQRAKAEPLSSQGAVMANALA